MSEALIFASTNPQYDARLFIELQVQYMKISSSNLGRTCCVQKLFLTLLYTACSPHVLQKEELLTNIYLYQKSKNSHRNIFHFNIFRSFILKHNFRKNDILLPLDLSAMRTTLRLRKVLSLIHAIG